MTNLGGAVWVELLKVRKSVALWITLGVSIFVVLLIGFMMVIIKDPETAKKFGIIGTKAVIAVGQADWQNYHKMLIQITALMGLMVYGFIASWIFGREYSDHTVKDLLALPTSRSIIVVAKATVIILWCALLATIILPLWFLVGNMVGLTGWDSSEAMRWIFGYIVATPFVILLFLPVTFIASVGRGYLAPLGFVVVTIMLTQVFGVLDHLSLIPWGLPLLILAADGLGDSSLNILSYLIYGFTVIIGLLATLLWWRFADQR